MSGLLAGLLMWTAMAQEPEGAGGVPDEAPTEVPGLDLRAADEPEPEPEPEPELYLDPFDAEAVWKSLLVPGNPLVWTDVELAPEPGGLVLATEPTGSVWLRQDGRWVRILEPIPGLYLGEGGMDIGLDLTAVDVILDQFEVTEFDFEAEAGADSAFETVRDEVGLMTDDTEDDQVRPRASQVALLEAGRLGVVRLDGVHWSDDMGLSWDTSPSTSYGLFSSMVRDPTGGTLVGSMGEGPALHHLDVEGRFTALQSTLGNVSVNSLATDGRVVFAAADGGIFVSEDRLTWDLVPQAPEGHAVFADPRYPGRLWVATPTSIVAGSLDGGRFSAPVGVMPQGVRDMAFGPGGLQLAAGDNGAWGRVDDGDTWRSVGRGLLRLGVGGVAVRQDVLIIAGEDGLRRLAVDEGLAPGADPRGRAWVPLPALVDASARRVGIASASDRLGSGRNALRYLLPQISVGLDWRDASDFESRIDQGIFPSVGGFLGFGARLTWVPPKRQTTIEVIGTDAGDQFSADNRSWGRSIEGDAVQQAQDAFALVTRLYRDRRELERELDLDPPGRTLLDKTHLALRVLEIEALLDAVTDGAVSDYNASRVRDKEQP